MWVDSDVVNAELELRNTEYFVVETTFPQGVERALLAVAERSSKEGFEVAGIAEQGIVVKVPWHVVHRPVVRKLERLGIALNRGASSRMTRSRNGLTFRAAKAASWVNGMGIVQGTKNVITELVGLGSFAKEVGAEIRSGRGVVETLKRRFPGPTR